MGMNPNCPPATVDKVSKTLRLIGYVIQKGVSMSKLMHDLQFVTKPGKNVRKAFHDLLIRRRRSLSCQSCDVQVSMASSPGALNCRPMDSHVPFLSPMPRGSCTARDADLYFISPIEYQFSCSGSPPRRSPYLSHISKRKTSTHPHIHSHSRRKNNSQYRLPRPSHSSSTAMRSAGSGYLREVSAGKDSSCEMDGIKQQQRSATDHVDEAAEEFIDRFYRELRLQKWFAAREASDYYYY